VAADLATFRMLFPEFSGSIDDQINFWITRSSNYLSQGNFNDCWEDAVLYHAAHNLAQSNARGRLSAAQGANAPGVIQSASADGTTTTFALPKYINEANASDTEYAKTAYGQKYLQIRENCIGSAQLIGTIARSRSAN